MCRNEAIGILKTNYDELSQALISPVLVSQLLYSRRYINEETLDKIEALEGSLYGKKKFLLSAIEEAVSLDYKNLEKLARILSEFEETRLIGIKILDEYGKKIVL